MPLRTSQFSFRLRKSRLDDVINEGDPLFVWQKCALHGIDREFFQILDFEMESVRGVLQFVRESNLAHESVIGIEHYSEFVPIENSKGVILKILDCPCMNIACQADFEGYSLVENKLSESSHALDHTAPDLHVFHDTGRVTDAVSTAPLNRLPD
jgi:hypothetical protein